jgi:hypothetical protein
MAASSAVARSQEVFRASWSIQDLSRGLEQPFAERVIERANDWLTRDDPNAPTARTDAAVRVTIVGEISPSGGAVRTHLSRLVLGTIPIDSSFSDFLDTATIASLMRRDQYWCDESVVVYNEALSPVAAHGEENPDSVDIFERAFYAPKRPKLRLALDESMMRISPDLWLWAGLGHEEIGLPGVSLGRVRAGIAFNQLKIWGELPAPIGSSGNALLARGLEGAYGLGVAFEKHGLGRIVSGLGGTVSAAMAGEDGGTPAVEGSDRLYILSKSAALYGIVPVRFEMLGDAPLLLKLGFGYTQATALPSIAGGSLSIADSTSGRGPKIMVRAEYASLAEEGHVRRNIAAELFGSTVLVSWGEQLTPAFGFRVTGAVHGILGDRDPFLPAYSIAFSPSFSIW